MLGFLVHKDGDVVGVATKDLSKGFKVQGRTLEGDREYELTVMENIPLGHKVAIRDIKKDEKIVEYGEIIGVATQDIPKGAHVHTHNIRSIRWG